MKKHYKHKIYLSIRVNKDLIEQLNKQIENIRFNEEVLKSRLLQMETYVKIQMKWEHALATKDIFNQLIDLSINLIEILNEIETSLSFCNLNLIHSSIIHPNDLQDILKQIFSVIKTKF